MKALRYTAYLLLASFSILLVHDLVPHHHHLGEEAHVIAHGCPEEHGHDHDHDQGHSPGHQHSDDQECCHAFNDLHFITFTPGKLPLPQEVLSALPREHPELELITSREVQEILQIAQKIPLDAYDPGAAVQLRAPPCLL